MIKKMYLSGALFALFSVGVLAQAPPIRWQKAIAMDTPYIKPEDDGGSGSLVNATIAVRQIIPVKGGNFILFDGGGIFKLNAVGDTLFRKSISFSVGETSTKRGYYMPMELVTTPDSGFAVIGFANPWDYTWPEELHKVYLSKFDDNANMQWKEEYSTGLFPYYSDGVHPLFGKAYKTTVAKSLTTTADGGYLLLVQTNAMKGGDKTEDTKDIPSQNESGAGCDYWVIKTDATGVVEWDKTIGGNFYDYPVKVIQLADGNYILAGYSNSPVSGDKSQPRKAEWFSYDYWVVKINQKGNIIWDKTIGTSERQEVPGIVKPTADGGFIVIGSSTAGADGDKTDAAFGKDSYDAWMIKFNSNGNILWQKTYGGSDNDGFVSAYEQADGSFIIGGSSNSPVSGNKTVAAPPGGYWIDPEWIDFGDGTGIWTDRFYVPSPHDYWVLKLSATGDIIWQTTLGGTEGENIGEAIPVKDGIMVFGSSMSGVSGNRTEINKTIRKIDAGSYTVDAAGSDLWIVFLKGCPSYSNVADTFCQGSTYSYNGQQITLPGTYTAVLKNVEGCDSTVTLTLAMRSATKPVIVRNNATLSVTGNYISYQWLLDGVRIPGATDSSIVFTSGGNYTVLATNANGCALMADAYVVLATGSVTQADAMVVPNPARDWVSIRFPEIIPSFYIGIVNMEGKKMGQQSFTNTNRPVLDVRKLPAGVYLLRLFGSDGSRASFKMIKGK